MRRFLPVILVALAACGYREHLNQFLHEFEELAKENVYLEHVTNFTVPSGMQIYVRINLQTKVLHAVLHPHTSLFHPDILVRHRESHGYVKSSINVDEYLKGTLLDEPDSRVLVHIKDNIITGTIETTENEKYFIEPSSRHVKELHDFHMIAYKLSDVRFNFTRPGEDGGHFCGHSSHDDQPKFSYQDFYFPKNGTKAKDGRFEYSRKKRDSSLKNKCPLALIGDYKFYSEVNEFEEANAINYMIGVVQQVDALYQQQSLDPAGSDDYKNYGFTISYIEVIKSADVTTDTTSHEYYESGYNPGVSNLLGYFAYTDWSNYCLAHLFTNYDFSGTLGLAYVAAAAVTRVGGICTKTYTDGTGQTKHLNVGLTTAISYGRSLLTSEMVYVTGHEFGHNWGSSHDSDTSSECAPSGNLYMMYPAAVDGSQTNNDYFSPCSKQAINDVLVLKSDICFTSAASTTSSCGNSVLEDEEECDAGPGDTDCCVSCIFTSGSVCEDSTEECCTNCQYASSGTLCLETNTIQDTSNYCVGDYKCAGDSTTCEIGGAVPDGTVCYDNGRCSGGSCTDICTYDNKLPCFCANETEICRQCCKGSEADECELYKTGALLANGQLCGNGMCVDGVCEVSAQDIQEKFWEVIDAIDVNSIVLWFRNNLVFTIALFTLILWIPITFYIGRLDDLYYSNEMEKENQKGSLISRDDDANVATTNV